jgi:hypothetical protein
MFIWTVLTDHYRHGKSSFDRWRRPLGNRKSEVKEKITGVHDVYFVFNGKAAKDIMFFDYWTFLENN